VPGGSIVDAARSERLAAAFAVAGIGASALAFAFWPVFPLVLGASVLHSAASCVLGPAIVAISVGLVGHREIGLRLGRNARFASLGNGLAAAAMGGCAYLFSTQAVFLVTAVLVVPTLMALARIRSEEIDPDRAHGGPRQHAAPVGRSDWRVTLRNPSLRIFALCAALFNFANAAMLPLVGSTLTIRSASLAPGLIPAFNVVAQEVGAVAAIIHCLIDRMSGQPDDGVEPLGALKAIPGLSGRPVVMLSGSVDPQHPRLSRELGAVAFLNKPVNPDVLDLVLDKYLA